MSFGSPVFRADGGATSAAVRGVTIIELLVVSTILGGAWMLYGALTDRAQLRLAHPARRIIRGFAGGAFEIHFPRRFTRLMKVLRWLPDRIYFHLISRHDGQ